ncbi:nucleoside 2-deoxyribosyltransferase [Halarcobacter mediterraneus]|uniref:Nucleoside 2-deoxyribosyltransferase n=1 Tax=Halarcobacter mediterraneus TaxID=2023153 RepID=A0A4Q1B3M9_9BACT|nr:nucleoside 2-deoxyribosyltransferase [Halarcobacter mediterraneus]RXK13435.1 nucleoside 2-deoxyribosyltransferase [Halarcobacter mediterraneus]
MKKIYIAGPDVFEQDSIQIGEEYTELCKKYGYEGLYPLDNVINFKQEKKKIAQDIFIANKKLIDSCDIVIANLNSFRGKECDSGTAWECGYASALGKKVYAYLKRTSSYQGQFSYDEKMSSKDGFVDLNGRIIENFDYPVNLMLACSVEKIIIGNFENVLQNLD